MKIDSVSTVPNDPVRMVGIGLGSPAIAQASQDTSGDQAQKVLQKDKPSAEEIKQNLDAINAQLRSNNSSIQFTVDGKMDDIVVKVVDDDTGKVIRQIPPDDVLSIREHLKEMSGLLVKEKA
ncbi:MAG: flagellar protein FlaG [Desulfomonilia bacterium]|jgi:flagellar protein FlaG